MNGPNRRGAATLLALASLTVPSAAGCGGDGDQKSTSNSVTATTSTADQSISETRQKLEDLVRELLTKRGLDPAIIDCALQRLSQTISDEEIEAAATAIKKTGSPTPAVIDAATQAGQQCAGN